MLILLAASVVTTLGAARTAPPTVAPVRCNPGAGKVAVPGRVQPRKLGELPPAQQIRAVWRFDANGCSSPVVVRSRVGNEGR